MSVLSQKLFQYIYVALGKVYHQVNKNTRFVDLNVYVMVLSLVAGKAS